MILSEVLDYIGKEVYINGIGDLAMDSEFRPYLYPRSEVPIIFVIVKLTRGGKVEIREKSSKKCLTLRAGNIDLVSEA